MHNKDDKNKRVTVLFRGRGAFTFVLKESKRLKNEAKWDGKINGKLVNCKIRFEINKHRVNKKGKIKEPGFKIYGTGTDDNKEFTIKSKYIDFDPSEFLENW